MAIIAIKVSFDTSLNTLLFRAIEGGDMNLGDYSAHDFFPLPLLNAISVFTTLNPGEIEIPMTSGKSVIFKLKKESEMVDGEQAVCKVFGEDIPEELTTEYEYAEWACDRIQKKWGITTTDLD